MKLQRKLKLLGRDGMKIKNDIIILDTNLWISFLITTDYTFLDEFIISQKSKLLISHELLEEFIEVASRQKFNKFFSQEDLANILILIEQYAKIIEIRSELKICRDEKDNFLLSLAVDGKADFLLTGDADLLDLKSINNTKIIKISDYKEMKIK